MATYIISYDLNKPGQDYSKLYNELKSYGTYWHNLDSTWLIVTDKTAAQVRDHLVKHIDASDRLLVVQSAGVGAWSAGFSKSATDWLHKNL